MSGVVIVLVGKSALAIAQTKCPGLTQAGALYLGVLSEEKKTTRQL
jgi:hypothetical protein